VSEQTLLWLFGIVITLQTLAIGGLGSRLWEHVVKCRDTTATVARAEAQIQALQKDLEGLRNWKHVVIDPYVPRAIDEHERRINRLDQKMDER
jgi:hypothetical protein